MSGRLPAMAAITGAFITMGVAASGAAAFHHSLVQDAQDRTPGAEPASIRLASLYDGAGRVYADIMVSAPAGHLSLSGGDILPVTLYDGDYTMPGGEVIPAGSMNTFAYAGLLEAARPVSAGDVLAVVLRHPAGEEVVAVRVQ